LSRIDALPQRHRDPRGDKNLRTKRAESIRTPLVVPEAQRERITLYNLSQPALKRLASKTSRSNSPSQIMI
jgi:hypothetical protein